MSSPAAIPPRLREWASALTLIGSGYLLFETVTGLAVHLLPFSVSNQIAVIVHTAVGVLLAAPVLVYFIRHYLAYRPRPMTHYKLTGYVAVIAALVALVSGFVLTAEGAFATRITYTWRTAHIISTYALIASLSPHVLLLMLRAAQRASGWGRGEPVLRYAVGTLALTVAGCGAWAAWTAADGEPVYTNAFPEGYGTPYGADRPFAPSLANTETGGAFDAASLAGSARCGDVGCHLDIYREWLPSAHRYAAMDPGFQVIQKTMAEQNGPESTRYCAGCHDPISLFSGSKRLGLESDALTGQAGYQEGISCLSCHAIRETDVKGNAAYVMTQPRPYLHEDAPSGLSRVMSNFLIRTYPEHHLATYSRRMFKTPEFCAACHKQFIDEEVNRVGWVQLQNQFDNWRKSRWNHPGKPAETIECRECHMPLSDSDDPAAGDPVDYNRDVADGRHRSHRFLGANQWIPALLKLEGADEHVALTSKWLRGELPIPEIADKWTEGAVVPIEIDAPDTVRPGDDIDLRVVITSNKVGHDFPTGPLDIIQAWVELEVVDDAGEVVFASGRRDDKNFIEPGTFMFKAEPVDQHGNLIDKHNLWEMVGVRYRRALFPGFSDAAAYVFPCPSSAAAANAGVGDDAAQAPNDGVREERVAFAAPIAATKTLTVKATLRYRKFDQYLLDFAFGKDAGLTAPTTVLSTTTRAIRVAHDG